MNNNFQFLVGIDFGAGETSASFYDIEGSVSAEKGERLHRLSIVNTGNVSKVYSAIRFVNNEWLLVTDPDDFRYADLRINFKKKVSEMLPVQQETIKTYWQLVFSSIVESNDFIFFDKSTRERNFLLSVARPSSWSNKDEEEYLSLMREAGLPVDIIVKESDAALVKWGKHANNGNTLVVDCGSSTIDLSLMCSGKRYDGALFKCEPQKGAQRIEELLAEYFETDKKYIADYKDVSDFLIQKESNLNLDDAIKLCLRNTKEKYYTNTPAEIYFTLRKRQFTNGPGDILDSIMSCEEFERIVSPYFNELRAFFQNVHITLKDSDITPNSIILSGGASRMPLVKTILTEVFGQGVNVFHDKNEADYVVSDGLALYLEEMIEASGFISIKKGYFFIEGYGSSENKLIKIDLMSTRQIKVLPSLKFSFCDLNGVVVFEKIIESVSFDEELKSEIILSVEDEFYNRYYRVSIESCLGFVGSFELFPKEIFIKVKELWFSMYKDEDYYIESCGFPLWWVLMPNSTRRDIRYGHLNIEIDEIRPDNYYGYSCSIPREKQKVMMVERFISVLRNSTGLPFTLLDYYDPLIVFYKERGFKLGYDPNDRNSNIDFKLTTEDYKRALNNNKSILPPQKHSWGIINSKGESLSNKESWNCIETLIQNRYNGLY